MLFSIVHIGQILPPSAPPLPAQQQSIRGLCLLILHLLRPYLNKNFIFKKNFPYLQETKKNKFTYFRGCIDVKNPDQEIINKMVDIAEALGAKVQDDEGTVYGKEGYLDRQGEDVRVEAEGGKRKWWRFWKGFPCLYPVTCRLPR